MPKISAKIFIPPQERQALNKLSAQARKSFSPFNKARLLGKQIPIWNDLAQKQKTRDASFRCGAITGIIGKKIDNLPVIKQLNAVRNFVSKVTDKITFFRAKHNF